MMDVVVKIAAVVAVLVGAFPSGCVDADGSTGPPLRSLNLRNLQQGTCGDGSVGNAKCADAELCCSIYGYCGSTNDYCGKNKATAEPTTAPQAPSSSPVSCGSDTSNDIMSVNFGYYASWAVYRAKTCNRMYPKDINVNGNHYTHLAYSFAGINKTYQIAPMGDVAATEVARYAKFNALKTSYPSLKTLISVGGGDFNATLFSVIAASSKRRAKFASSIIAFLQKHGFDGVDVDWESPGDPDRGGRRVDYQNFPLLLKAIRDASTAAGKTILITTASTVGIDLLNLGYNLPSVAQQLDFFNLMAYDINGPWNDPKIIGANTDLPYIQSTVQYMLQQGVPSSKMVLGLAAYGRTFKLANRNCKQPGCRFTAGGPGGCAGDTGDMPYFTIDQYVQSHNYTSLQFNAQTSSMELVINKNVWISYDNPYTWNIKAAYAAATCMRGVMWWSVDQLVSPIVLDTYNS